MTRKIHGMIAMIGFGLTTSAMFVEGARPPRFPRPGSGAPVAAFTSSQGAGPDGLTSRAVPAAH